ncbi:hypothetical protein ACN95_12655 [Gordonia sihwensis]|uniref:hypothetical protein n=1 Tax=Gordonia sihwensis TaxID=173559 RepID=UPI001C92DF4A|nr:hypothetical protein [Gordonia sihwensis]MBY4570864.1 hypothetical protein [Gordonia sihwensis]
MDTRSRSRRQRRTRLTTGLTAVAASAALLAGGVGAAPANAANGLPDFPSHKCAPGQQTAPSPVGDTVDCGAARPAVLAKIGDGLIGLVLPDLGLNLADMNSATAISLAPLFGTSYPGAATIAGTGLASALAVGGTANAQADAFLSGAISVGSLGAVSDSRATGGLGLSIGAGVSETSVRALPLGVAIAMGLGENATATALGGVAVATGFLDGIANAPDPTKSSVICTALYGKAQVTDGETGKNYSSCTSVAFIFQKSQQGDGPVVYSIKNPFSLTLGSPLAPMTTLLDMVGALGIPAPFPDSVTGILTGNVIPTFSQDLIRIVMTDHGPRIETDLFAKKPAPTPPATEPSTASTATRVADVQATSTSAAADSAQTTVGSDATENTSAETTAPSGESSATEPAPAADAAPEPAPTAEAPAVTDEPAAEPSQDSAAEQPSDDQSSEPAAEPSANQSVADTADSAPAAEAPAA